MLDLAEGVPVESKHAVDYMRLAELVDPSNVEAAWQDDRKPTHPKTFHETAAVLHNLIPARSSLLVKTRVLEGDLCALSPLCAYASFSAG